MTENDVLRERLTKIADLAGRRVRIDSAEEALGKLRDDFAKQDEEICQVLGQALGYPRFKDDPESFPGATEADGVCVGDHVAVSLAMEAADRIRGLMADVEALKAVLSRYERMRR